jgi:hypothetical protein
VSDAIRTERVFFLMVHHPLNGRIRVGNAHRTEQAARDWRPFVRGAWRGCRVSVSPCTLRWVGGQLDERSVRVLDQKYNLDAPQGLAVA